ncbi:MAG: sigma-E factor negative regulatory protein [Woeseiaceae bacterium]|nr:sigma-E factor negative regulatory protein [Woeseiaceae bacterium]
MNDTIREQISAFVDGELPDNEAELLLRRMSQDAGLRSLVSEYLEIGRVMRGESSIRSMDSLRERVAAEIDDRPSEPHELPDAVDGRRSWRPFAGAAVAAVVAVAAIFGLQQVQLEQPADNLLADQVVESVDGSYTVPPNEDVLRRYLMSHGAETSSLGANGIGARWVSLDLSAEIAVQDAPAAEEPVGDESVEQ